MMMTTVKTLTIVAALLAAGTSLAVAQNAGAAAAPQRVARSMYTYVPVHGGSTHTHKSISHAQVASIYGGGDGFCGHRTANGERLNCAAMTAAHRSLPFGSLVRVCHSGCATVRINDRGPWVRGRDIDLSPAAARAIGLHQTGQVTISRL
jgi:rare lipoprotein A